MLAKCLSRLGMLPADAVRDSGGKFARIVIAVSEEAETYLPEMEWLSEQLQKSGFSIGSVLATRTSDSG